MAEKSEIEWTEATWNPWHGCLKVSPGCKFCYMYREKAIYGQDPMKVVRSKTKFSDPLKWREPKLVFTCSWSDWFIAEADGWRAEAWEIVRRTPQHTYQILTKRPERIEGNLPEGWPYPNVWLGVSVESDDYRWRIDELRKHPAAVRFLSVEPLLSEIELGSSLEGIDWVIVGGESGPEARPMDSSWVTKVILQCREADVPVFVKQMGEVWAKANRARDRKGGSPSEWPEGLRLREWPKVYKVDKV